MTITYVNNAAVIQDAAWGGFPANKRNVLTEHLDEVVADLAAYHIKYAICFVGYWNYLTNNINYTHTDTQWTTIINAFHAANIIVLAWAEDDTIHPMDITAANRDNLYASITACMAKGFDGYLDDIELYNGTLQEWIDYNNGATTVLHGLGKLMTAAVPYDWDQTRNMYLVMDFICTMFYGNISALEHIYGEAFWQENFGEYGEYYPPNNHPPASPLIMILMNYYGNQYPLAWQLRKAGEYHDTYLHPQLNGFASWLYEYMGTTFDDWLQWDYWIERIGTVNPPLYTIAVASSPIPIQLNFNGTLKYTPKTLYGFTGIETLIAPSEAQGEEHSVLFGDSDRSGGALGYSVFTYASGPFTLGSPATIDSVYIYTPVAGNIKIAIYDSTNYHIPGWVGTDEHPNHIMCQSSPTACAAGTWNLISIPSTPLSAGIYFIGIKCDTSLMIGQSGILPPEYGHNQAITQSYSAPFSDPYPTPEAQMGYDASAYVPTAPIVYTTYYFERWEDNSTEKTRIVVVDSNKDLIVYYITEGGGTGQRSNAPFIGYRDLRSLYPRVRTVI
jgi:hypothetical protein